MTKEDLNRLHERIDALAEGIGEIRENVARMATLCPRHDAAIQQIRLTLHGPPENGRNPGIVGRVAALESWRKAMRLGMYGLWTVAAGGGAIALEALCRQLFGG